MELTTEQNSLPEELSTTESSFVTNGENKISECSNAFNYVKGGRINHLSNVFRNNPEIDLTEKDTTNEKTLLHYAVLYRSRSRALEMTELILNHAANEALKRKLVEIQDNKGETALHSAAKNGRARIVEVLLPLGPDWKLRGKDNQTALDCVYKNVPQVVVTDCDACVNYSQDGEGSCEELVTLDFKRLIRHPENEEEVDRLKEVSMLGGLITDDADRFRLILEHPVVQVFLHLKYGKCYSVIVASIVIQILWQLIYGYFLFHVYFQACPWKLLDDANGNSAPNKTFELSVECDGRNLDFPGIFFAVIVWILAIIFLTKEIFEFSTVTAFRYFSQLENIGQLFGIMSVIWTCLPIYERLSGVENTIINPWQYNLAAASEFTVWTLVLGQICKLRPLRIYIQIFVKVFKSFVLFICTFASLLFGFAAAFCIIMPQAKAFQSPWLAIPKVLVMMTGELNYDDVFHSDEGGPKLQSTTSHYFTSQILFSMFTILMSLILLNLLIGLAVTDTQALRENCRTAELSSMLEEIYLLESFAARIYIAFGNKWLLERLSVTTKSSSPSWLKHSGEIDLKVEHGSVKDMESGSCVSEKRSQKVTLEFSRAFEYPFPDEVMNRLRELADAKVKDEQEEESII